MKLGTAAVRRKDQHSPEPPAHTGIGMAAVVEAGAGPGFESWVFKISKGVIF